MAQTIFVQMVKNVTTLSVSRTLETPVVTNVLRNHPRPRSTVTGYATGTASRGRIGRHSGGYTSSRHFSSVTHEATHSWHAKLRSVGQYCSGRFTVLAVLFSKQCNAIAAQRVRRSIQIANLYIKLGYDKRSIQKLVERFSNRWQGGWQHGKGRRLYFIFGAIGFSWDKEKITDDEINRYV